MKIKLIYLFTFFILFSCSKEKKTDFLDFKLGMSKKNYEKTINSLIEQGRIYRSSSSRNRYDFNVNGNKIGTFFYGRFALNELREIDVFIGRWEENQKNSKYGHSICIKENVVILFELYKSKYGQPEVIKLDKQYKWIIDNKEIIFNKGRIERLQIEGAFITYKFTENYLKKTKTDMESKTLNDI